MWERLFAHTEPQEVPRSELEQLRARYTALLGALAEAVQLNERRLEYVTSRVVENPNIKPD